LGPLAGLDAASASVVLRLVIAERRRREIGPELVWTGPEAPGSTARDTAVVVRRLFEAAQRRVMIAGFDFTKGTEILRPLHAAMRDRGVTARVFLNVKDKAPSRARIDEYVGPRIAESFNKWWTFGAPRPDVYFDPRTVDPAEKYSSLHAKCVVVDGEVAFVGSANFTQRAYEHNIEVGVLVRDRGFASRLAAQWANLVEAGLVRRYVAGGTPTRSGRRSHHHRP
ncbi:MAG: hypothetical protein GY856_55140, partial [bacterium]|nr:hypothetical protein [bacterium]